MIVSIAETSTDEDERALQEIIDGMLAAVWCSMHRLYDCASSMMTNLCDRLRLHTDYHSGSLPLEMTLQLCVFSCIRPGIVLGLILVPASGLCLGIHAS